MVIVVDDLALTSNSPKLMADFRGCLLSIFDVKFFRKLKTFIGLEIWQGPEGFIICHRLIVDELLKKCNMDAYNATSTPIPTDADIGPALEIEVALGRLGHKLFRKKVDELLYLTIYTRPEI